MSIRCYALPLPDSYVLWVPPVAGERLAGLAWWADRQLAPLQIELFTPEQFARAPRSLAAVTATVRAAALAAMADVYSEAVPGPVWLPGPQGRWVAALTVWGFLTVFFAGGSTMVVLAGLWLLLGWPWVRALYRRRLAAVTAESTRGLSRLGGEEPSVTQVPHPALTALDDAVASVADAAAACRQAALLCRQTGMHDWCSAYAAIAADTATLATGHHALIPRQVGDQAEECGDRPV